jgi:hypothetical protein
MQDILKDLLTGFWPFLALGLLIGFFVVALLILGALEKRYIHDFEPASRESLPPASAYFEAMNEAAKELGFSHGGTFSQSRKNRLYRCMLAMWLDSEEKALLCIGGGKLAGMNYWRTFLASWVANDQVMITTDNFGDEDLSATRQIEVLLSADLEELQDRHFQRLAAIDATPGKLSSNRLLHHYEEIEKLRVDRLVQLGLASYVDQAGNIWRFTLKGAWANATRGYFKAIDRAEEQSDRKRRSKSCAKDGTPS